MKIRIEITEKDLKQLIIDHLETTLGLQHFEEKDVSIQVKSKQNFRSEWEKADFKAVYETN